MKSITINGSKRESVGKSSSKALRNAGQIPCVLYGGDGPIAGRHHVNGVKVIARRRS